MPRSPWVTTTLAKNWTATSERQKLYGERYERRRPPIPSRCHASIELARFFGDFALTPPAQVKIPNRRTAPSFHGTLGINGRGEKRVGKGAGSRNGRTEAGKTGETAETIYRIAAVGIKAERTTKERKVKRIERH